MAQSTEEAQRIKQLFDEADADGSGAISLEEMENFLTALAGGVKPSTPALNALREVMDTDQDGTINYDEFVPHLGRWLVDQEAVEKESARIKELFDQFDADGSGTVSVDELAAMLEVLADEKPTDTELQSFKAMMDTDGDGSISFEEFKPTMGTWLVKQEKSRVAFLNDPAIKRHFNRFWLLISTDGQLSKSGFLCFFTLLQKALLSEPCTDIDLVANAQFAKFAAADGTMTNEQFSRFLLIRMEKRLEESSVASLSALCHAVFTALFTASLPRALKAATDVCYVEKSKTKSILSKMRAETEPPRSESQFSDYDAMPDLTPPKDVEKDQPPPKEADNSSTETEASLFMKKLGLSGIVSKAKEDLKLKNQFIADDRKGDDFLKALGLEKHIAIHAKKQEREAKRMEALVAKMEGKTVTDFSDVEEEQQLDLNIDGISLDGEGDLGDDIDFDAVLAEASSDSGLSDPMEFTADGEIIQKPPEERRKKKKNKKKKVEPDEEEDLADRLLKEAQAHDENKVESEEEVESSSGEEMDAQEEFLAMMAEADVGFAFNPDEDDTFTDAAVLNAKAAFENILDDAENMAKDTFAAIGEESEEEDEDEGDEGDTESSQSESEESDTFDSEAPIKIENSQGKNALKRAGPAKIAKRKDKHEAKKVKKKQVKKIDKRKAKTPKNVKAARATVTQKRKKSVRKAKLEVIVSDDGEEDGSRDRQVRQTKRKQRRELVLLAKEEWQYNPLPHVELAHQNVPINTVFGAKAYNSDSDSSTEYFSSSSSSDSSDVPLPKKMPPRKVVSRKPLPKPPSKPSPSEVEASGKLETTELPSNVKQQGVTTAASVESAACDGASASEGDGEVENKQHIEIAASVQEDLDILVSSTKNTSTTEMPTAEQQATSADQQNIFSSINNLIGEIEDIAVKFSSKSRQELLPDELISTEQPAEQPAEQPTQTPTAPVTEQPTDQYQKQSTEQVGDRDRKKVSPNNGAENTELQGGLSNESNDVWVEGFSGWEKPDAASHSAVTDPGPVTCEENPVKPSKADPTLSPAKPKLRSRSVTPKQTPSKNFVSKEEAVTKMSQEMKAVPEDEGGHGTPDRGELANIADSEPLSVTKTWTQLKNSGQRHLVDVLHENSRREIFTLRNAVPSPPPPHTPNESMPAQHCRPDLLKIVEPSLWALQYVPGVGDLASTNRHKIFRRKRIKQPQAQPHAQVSRGQETFDAVTVQPASRLNLSLPSVPATLLTPAQRKQLMLLCQDAESEVKPARVFHPKREFCRQLSNPTLRKAIVEPQLLCNGEDVDVSGWTNQQECGAIESPVLWSSTSPTGSLRYGLKPSNMEESLDSKEQRDSGAEQKTEPPAPKTYVPVPLLQHQVRLEFPGIVPSSRGFLSTRARAGSPSVQYPNWPPAEESAEVGNHTNVAVEGATREPRPCTTNLVYTGDAVLREGGNFAAWTSSSIPQYSRTVLSRDVVRGLMTPPTATPAGMRQAQYEAQRLGNPQTPMSKIRFQAAQELMYQLSKSQTSRTHKAKRARSPHANHAQTYRSPHVRYPLDPLDPVHAEEPRRYITHSRGDDPVAISGFPRTPLPPKQPGSNGSQVASPVKEIRLPLSNPKMI